MPTKKNTARKPSARKRARQAIKARARNFSNRAKARTAIKNARSSIVKKDAEEIKISLTKVNSTLDKIAKKNVIHRNKAARIKSRLSALAKQAQA